MEKCHFEPAFQGGESAISGVTKPVALDFSQRDVRNDRAYLSFVQRVLFRKIQGSSGPSGSKKDAVNSIFLLPDKLSAAKRVAMNFSQQGMLFFSDYSSRFSNYSLRAGNDTTSKLEF